MVDMVTTKNAIVPATKPMMATVMDVTTTKPIAREAAIAKPPMVRATTPDKR